MTYQFAFVVFFPAVIDRESLLSKLGASVVEDSWKGDATHPWLKSALELMHATLADHFRSSDKRFCFFVVTHTTLVEFTRAVIVAASNQNVFSISAIEPTGVTLEKVTNAAQKIADAGPVVSNILDFFKKK